MVVTIVAYKRPELLRQCLESIAKAKTGMINAIFVSCDCYDTMHGDYTMHAKMRWVYENCESRIADHKRIFTEFREQPTRLGVANHPRWVFNYVRQNICGKNEPIVALEEDTIVSPDCFLFADWAVERPGYKFVNLACTLVRQVEKETRGPTRAPASRVHEDNCLRSPYGWAFLPRFWEYELEPEWNGKIRAPYGWDWQLTYLCFRENWRSLTPQVARVYNTGRVDGTYDTPESWDATQKNVVICSAVPDRYVVIKHNFDGVIRPKWVEEEMKP